MHICAKNIIKNIRKQPKMKEGLEDSVGIRVYKDILLKVYYQDHIEGEKHNNRKAGSASKQGNS